MIPGGEFGGWDVAETRVQVLVVIALANEAVEIFPSVFDSDNELVAHILLGVLSYFAQLEASKISSRTKAGLERVRAQGKTLGRPDGFTLHGPVLARMKAEGYSQGRMSRETGLAINTVKGYLKRLEAATP